MYFCGIEMYNLTHFSMSKKTNYESPLAEIISMPLESVICGSVPDAGGMNFGNPFGGNTEDEWL